MPRRAVGIDQPNRAALDLAQGHVLIFRPAAFLRPIAPASSPRWRRWITCSMLMPSDAATIECLPLDPGSIRGHVGVLDAVAHVGGPTW